MGENLYGLINMINHSRAKRNLTYDVRRKTSILARHNTQPGFLTNSHSFTAGLGLYTLGDALFCKRHLFMNPLETYTLGGTHFESTSTFHAPKGFIVGNNVITKKEFRDTDRFI